MTYLNAIRYYYKRLKYAHSLGNYELAMHYINEAMGEIPNNYMNYCDFCYHDDFGYCGLRRSSQPYPPCLRGDR